MVVYHGTQSEFNAFDKDAVRERGDGVKGSFFATAARRESVAGYYAQDGGSIMPVFLNIKRPLVLSTSEQLGAQAKLVEMAKKEWDKATDEDKYTKEKEFQ